MLNSNMQLLSKADLYHDDVFLCSPERVLWKKCDLMRHISGSLNTQQEYAPAMGDCSKALQRYFRLKHEVLHQRGGDGEAEGMLKAFSDSRMGEKSTIFRDCRLRENPSG